MAKRTRINKKENVKKAEILIQQQEQYSGIIPHPSIIEGYEKNCSGATDRILAMTENQLKSNQELSKLDQENINECRKEALRAEIENVKRGQILGFILILIMLLGGFILVIPGKDAGGYASIVASIMLSIGSVIWNNMSKKDQEKEDEDI